MIINESYFEKYNEATIMYDGLNYIVNPPAAGEGTGKVRSLKHNNRLKVTKPAGGGGRKGRNRSFGMSFPIVMNDEGQYVLDLEDYEFEDNTTNINSTDMNRLIGIARSIGEQMPEELIACYKDPTDPKLKENFRNKLKQVKLNRKELK